MKKIGERIRDVRNHFRLNKKQFADELRISATHAGAIESGKSEPSEMLIKLICLNFGVNEPWLVTGEGDMTINAPKQIPAFQSDLIDALQDPSIEKVVLLLKELGHEETVKEVRNLEDKKRLRELEKKVKEMQQLLGNNAS